jgi:hypothetical protein
MDEVKRVLKWFEEGRLVRPGSSDNIVDLIHAIAAVCGANGVKTSPRSAALAEKIGVHDHVLFVLIDGLGLQLLRDLSRRQPGFLQNAVVHPLLSVYPSTTAVAITSLATGAYPCKHGIPGWWTYFEELNATAEILPFVERFSKRSMLEFGAKSEEIFNVPSLLPRFKHSPFVVTRTYIANSIYSRYWSGESPSCGYERVSDGVDQAIKHINEATAPSYTHLYLPQLDEMCHRHGVDHADVQQLFEMLDSEMERLHLKTQGKVRMIISADHGHVNRQQDRHIHDGDPILALLKCPPSGEPSVPVFHVRPGQEQALRDEFARAFGDIFALLSIQEVEDLRLLGPEPLSPSARAHFGDFVGIPQAPNTIHYIHPHVKTHIHRGIHAGMTPGEMWVPLMLA